MDEKKVLNSLQEIFADIFDDDSIIIDRNTNTNDITNWDSLSHICLLEAVQSEWGISFELDEIIDMRNVGDIVDAILRKV